MTGVDAVTCPWWCPTCKRCHDNACPFLWGGTFVPGGCGQGPCRRVGSRHHRPEGGDRQ